MAMQILIICRWLTVSMKEKSLEAFIKSVPLMQLIPALVKSTR